MTFLKQAGASWLTALLFRTSLFYIPLLDELVSGIPVLALPLIRAELQLSYSQIGLLLTVGQLTGLFIDPGLNAASDLWPKRRLVLGGMMGMVLGFAVAGSSSSFGWLLLALVIVGATNGAAVGISEAALMDEDPHAALAKMTRWTFMATIGDVLAPVLIAAAIALQSSWRLLMWGGAVLWLAGIALFAPQRFPQAEMVITERHSSQSALAAIRGNLRTALQTPTLVRWLVLALIPSFLDEMFLGFAGLFLQEIVGLTPAVISGALSAPIVGSILGLAMLERLGRRFRAEQLLGGAAIVALGGLISFVTAHTLWQALLGLFFTGLGAACWYPVAQAAAYAALPGRSGTVRALASLGAPMEIAAPLLLGVVAEEWGIQIGVGVLMLAPVLIFMLRPRGSS